MTIFNALHRSARLSLVLLALMVAGGVAAAPAMAEFGLQRFALAATNENGTPDVQAGSHPYALTSTFLLNLPTNGNDIKDVKLELPPGLWVTPMPSRAVATSGSSIRRARTKRWSEYR